MSIETPTNPYKTDVYKLYVTWKSLPYFYKLKAPEELKNQLGIDDPIMLELLTIRNQADFAKTYKVDPTTITSWNGLISQDEITIEMKNWARKMTKGVIAALHNHSLKRGGANIKLWLQYVEEFEEKNQTKHTGSIDFTSKLSPVAKANIEKIIEDDIDQRENEQRTANRDTKGS